MTDERRSVLLFYPHNFTAPTSGTERRLIELLHYFRDRRIPVDLYSLNGFTNSWPVAQAKSDLYRELYVFPWPKGPFTRIGNAWRRWMRELPNYAVPSLKRHFQSIAKAKNYSHVIVSYVYWTDLIDGLKGSQTVIEMQDICTLGFFHKSGESTFRFGKMLERELQLIDRFDVVLSISREETILLQPFCQHAKIADAPMTFAANPQPIDTPFKYDIIFIGSGNEFNVQGINWFLREVLPLLRKSAKILIVGQVCKHISPQSSNVTLLPAVKSLDDCYRESQIAISPLFGGTGMKVKVVEALSYGRPVVATKQGVIGMGEDATGGCIVADDPEAFARGINGLIEDPESYKSLVEAAGRNLRQSFSRTTHWPALDKIFL